jgi:hypothetical protein
MVKQGNDESVVDVTLRLEEVALFVWTGFCGGTWLVFSSGAFLLFSDLISFLLLCGCCGRD